MCGYHYGCLNKDYQYGSISSRCTWSHFVWKVSEVVELLIAESKKVG